MFFMQEWYHNEGKNKEHCGIKCILRNKHSLSVVKTSQLMLFREITAVCSEIHKQHINTLSGHNVGFLVIDHWALSS